MIWTVEAADGCCPSLPCHGLNNGWANHRLLAACVRLSQADFVAPRTGFFPSLRATLNHILIIDLFYVDALEGGTLGRQPGRTPSLAKLQSCSELRRARWTGD